MIIRNKVSSDYIAKHTQDIFTDLGYKYKTNVFRKTMSPVIMANENNKGILMMIEKMVVKLIDTVKQIRLQYMISLDKTDTNLN